MFISDFPFTEDFPIFSYQMSHIFPMFQISQPRRMTFQLPRLHAAQNFEALTPRRFRRCQEGSEGVAWEFPATETLCTGFDGKKYEKMDGFDKNEFGFDEK